MSLRTAAQQALDEWHTDPGSVRMASLMMALRTALAEPEQEPVAWSTREHFYEALDRAVENVRQEMLIKTVTMRCKNFDIALPVIDAYGGHVLVGQVSHPPQRKPLTDEELKFIADQYGSVFGGWEISFARAIERAHGIGGEA
jgi:hypothetical protein